jgi:hypothetical protein
MRTAVAKTLWLAALVMLATSGASADLQQVRIGL